MDPLSHQLFIDDEIIESTVRLTRRYHKPAYIYGPVLRAEHPWEGTALCLFGSIIRDGGTGRFRMWYLGWRVGSHQRPDGQKRIMNLCYAESEDGVHWEKPELGLVEWNGSKDNNIISIEHSNPTVIEDPLDPDPKRRFKVFKHGREPGLNRRDAMGHYVSFSPDGLHLGEWKRIIHRCGDRHTFMYDPRLERPWVCYTRPPGYEEKYQRRMVARLDSADVLNWSEPEPMLVPDLNDPVDCQYYAFYAFPYEDLYLGFLHRLFGVEDNMDIELLSSRDSRTWTRDPRRSAFMSWNMKEMGPCKQVTLSHNPPIDFYDVLYLYYDCRRISHYKITPGNNSYIGLASLYKDRFVSLFAGHVEGTVVTKSFTCPGGALIVNVDTCATSGNDHGTRMGPGYALCEILDDSGNPIPGFTKGDCERFCDDCRVGRPYRWGNVEKLDALNDKTIKLKFYLVETDLYSFWFDPSEKIDIPRFKTRQHVKE